LISVFKIRTPRQAYTIGLALIGVLVTLQFAGSQFVTERQAVSAVEINLSGRQRMLSQRIGWTLYRIAAEPAISADTRPLLDLRAVLAACVDLMERSHRALQARDLVPMQEAMAAGANCLAPERGVGLPLPADRTPLTEESILAEFTARAWAVATQAVSQEEVFDVARSFEGPLIELLAQLDAATFEAQRSSTEQIQRLLSLNWILILALIAGEILLIFRPMAHAVDRAMNRLRDTNARLTESEARLQDFAATAAHQLWETDADHKYTYVAAAKPEMRLAKPAELLGKTLWEVEGIDETSVDGPDWDKLRATLDAREPVRGFEYARKGSKEQRSWWRLNGQPVFSSQGAFMGYRGTSLEITSEHEAQERLRLSERMMAVGQLTAGIAHDFNNILAVIQGNAELLPMERSVAGRKRNTREIVEAVRRGASLTSRLLAFGRVQSLRPEPIEMRSFLIELEALLSRTLGEDFNVAIAIPDEVIHVLADPHQLEDAALNLALNARDAAMTGGRLWIDATRQTIILPENGMKEAGGTKEFVKLTFRDNGNGISESVQERIFEPFFTTKPTGEGSGLGLSMVYGFAHQSGGFLDVESKLGKGTIFDLYLPYSHQVAEPKHPVETQQFVGIGQGRTALLVEDNPSLRDVVKRQLERLGFLVLAVSDGGSAIECLKDKGPFDFLLLDIVLPGGIDGVDIASFALEQNEGTAFLFCTGFAEDKHRRSRQRGLPGPVITKPFSLEDLQNAISQLLAQARQRKETDLT